MRARRAARAGRAPRARAACGCRRPGDRTCGARPPRARGGSARLDQARPRAASTNSDETRLPSERPRRASARRLTGTIARIPPAGGSSPRPSSSCRSPAVTSASTTSLTVPPSARPIALTRASSTCPTARRRCSPQRHVEARLRRAGQLVAQGQLDEPAGAVEHGRGARGVGGEVEPAASGPPGQGGQVVERAVLGGSGGCAGARQGPGDGLASSMTVAASMAPTPSTRQ